MNEEEIKAFKELLEKFRETRRDNETPEQGKDKFRKHIEDTINTDNEKE